jgi:hypothetical protein
MKNPNIKKSKWNIHLEWKQGNTKTPKNSKKKWEIPKATKTSY